MILRSDFIISLLLISSKQDISFEHNMFRLPSKTNYTRVKRADGRNLWTIKVGRSEVGQSCAMYVSRSGLSAWRVWNVWSTTRLEFVIIIDVFG